MPPNLFQSLSSLSTSPASPLDSTADADYQEEVEANDAKDHLPKFCHRYTWLGLEDFYNYSNLYEWPIKDYQD